MSSELPLGKVPPPLGMESGGKTAWKTPRRRAQVSRSNHNGQERSGILTFDADSQGPEKLSILRRQPENGFLVQVGIELLAVDEISFAPLVEPDGHFQDEEKVVSRSANAGQDVRNLIRFRQRLVDGVAQFFD
jgi:hypothetical protein